VQLPRLLAVIIVELLFILTMFGVILLVGAIVLGHLYDIARQQEHWPFSNYPMWARPGRERRPGQLPGQQPPPPR